MSEQATQHKPKRARSPSYPGIPLRTAIERARQLYEAEGRNAAPIDAIYEDWGYAPKSGAGNVAIAALKKFGLIDDEGTGPNRRARLSNLALQILLDDREDSVERADAMRKAALAPKIYRDIWDRSNGELPSDANLRHFLRFERGFTGDAANDVVRMLHDTVAFAGLEESDSVSLLDGDNESEEQNRVTTTLDSPPLRKPLPGAPSPIQLPLLGGTVVTLQASGPVSDEAWEQMMTVLTALKPGFVAPPLAPDRETVQPDE